MPDNVVRTDISPSNHPGVIRGDGPSARTARAALTTMFDTASNINDIQSKIADKGLLAKRAIPVAERAVAHAGRAIDTIGKQIAHLDTEIAAAIGKKIEPNLANAIRAHFAPTKIPLKEIGDLIGKGDLTTTAAILGAPPYLSGLTDKSHGVLRGLAERRFAPEQVAAREEAVASLGRLELATQNFAAATAEQIRGWQQRDEEILESLK